jgi:membrane-associated phospholipid phosphatase
MITDILKQSKLFLIPYVIVVAGCCIFLLNFSKADIHLWINRHYSPFADIFFKYYTHIGAGLVALCFSLILVFWKYGYAIFVFSSYLFSSIIVQIIKRGFFPYVMRPTTFFSGKADLHIVSGMEPNVMQSFPSGHSATAFAFFLALSLITKNKWFQIAFLICALLVGYSRIYLSEHFLIDVFTGSLIGVITTLVVYYIYEKNQRDWMNRSLKFKV